MSTSFSFLFSSYKIICNYKVGEGVVVVMMGKQGYYKKLHKYNTISSTMIKVSTMCIEMQ